MRLDQYTKNTLQKRATEFFLRLQHTNPFPAFKEEVVPKNKDLVYNTFISCLPPDIRHAVLLLITTEAFTEFLDTNTASTLTVDVTYGVDPVKRIPIKFEFGGERYPSCGHWSKSHIDSDHSSYDEIVQWARRAKEINKDYRRCQSYLAYVIEYANTVGQLRTMFPEYINLLPEKHQQHIAGMKKRSTLPKTVDMGFLNEHRQFVTEKAALCLLLPEGGEKIWLK